MSLNHNARVEMKHVTQGGDSLPWELNYLAAEYVVIGEVSAHPKLSTILTGGEQL